MKFSFVPGSRLIFIRAEVHGHAGMASARFALDTGASASCISPQILLGAGIDPGSTDELRELVTGNGPVTVRMVPVFALRSLGQIRYNFRVACHSLLGGSGIDGLLGLDFLRPFSLNIDFRAGKLELS